jgi:putative FmdB family regulatory protein
MPTYDYLCKKCSHTWESDHSIKDPPLTTCPSCKEETAVRQISGKGSFILQGGGWYSEGYSSK